MKLRLLALAALATVGTAPAHAAADSSASFTNITFQLFDLDGAGVGDTPTLSFIGGAGYFDAGSYVYSSVSVNDPDNGIDGATLDKIGARSNTSKTVSVNYGSALASASIVGNNMALSGEGIYTTTLSSISASGASGSPSAGGTASYNATARIPYQWWTNNFVLGNNTMVLIRADADVSATNSVGNDGMYSEYAYANLSFSGSAVGAGGSGSQSFSDSLSVYNWYSPGTYTDSRSLVGTFSNVSGGNLEGRLSMEVSATGSSSVVSTPVPEPEAYAMMLAGLGALGFIGRRRKQQK